MVELIDGLGRGEISEPVPSQLGEAGIVELQRAEEAVGGEAGEYLPSVGRFEQTGGAVDRWAEVVAAPFVGAAGMQRHPYREREPGHRSLTVHGCGHRGRTLREGDAEAVTAWRRRAPGECRTLRAGGDRARLPRHASPSGRPPTSVSNLRCR